MKSTDNTDPIETDRLRLRKLTPEDAPFILRLLNDPSFIRHIGDKKVRNLDDARTYIKKGPMESHETHGFGLDCVELKTSAEPMGICGLLKRPELNEVDLGYAFLPKFRGKGYAGEAAAAVAAHAAASHNLKSIAAIVSPGNNPSITLLKKLGFKLIEKIRLDPSRPEVLLYRLILLPGIWDQTPSEQIPGILFYEDNNPC